MAIFTLHNLKDFLSTKRSSPPESAALLADAVARKSDQPDPASLPGTDHYVLNRAYHGSSRYVCVPFCLASTSLTHQPSDKAGQHQSSESFHSSRLRTMFVVKAHDHALTTSQSSGDKDFLCSVLVLPRATLSNVYCGL